MKDALILFTRVPIPGQTKTRLMPFLTGEECARLHACFVKDIYEKAKQVDADIFVFFTPKDEKKLLQQVLDNETVCLPQFGDDLGERMKNAIGIVLRMGYEKVILIGTDIPQIHPETLKNAFDNLGGKDIVIHPTFDGGYYLIGMKKEYDSIWKIERYGTNTVIYDTLQHMRNEKLSTAVGQMYYDVDDKGDLYHLYEDIEKGAICNCPITIDYLELGQEKINEIRDYSGYRCCINTELNSGNFLMNGAGKDNYLVDWEKPLYGDPVQDLGHFLAPTTTFWKTDVILTEEEMADFTRKYIQAVNGRFDVSGIEERLNIFIPITCLRGITWCAMAWVEYQEPGRLIRNEETFKKMEDYLKRDFLDMIEERYYK